MSKKTRNTVIVAAVVIAFLMLAYLMRDKFFKKKAEDESSADFGGSGGGGGGGGGTGVAIPFIPQAPTTTGGSAETPDWQTASKIDKYRPTMGWTYTQPDGKERPLMGR